MATAIGIDLGGTRIKGVLIDDQGNIIHQAIQTTSDAKGNHTADEQWKGDVCAMVRTLKGIGGEASEAIGLAAPGLVNESNSAIRVMPQRLAGLENFEWGDYLNESGVCVVNDAHAALLAEARFGAGKGMANIVMLTLGTGVGGGILINGELYQGNFQKAGHLGHMTLDVDMEDTGITGMPGTLENAIGNATVAKRSLGRFASTDALVEAYHRGDTFAAYVWINSVRKLSLALCSLSNLLSPDVIILGGGITKANEALYKPLADFMDVYEWKGVGRRTPVKQAFYSDMAGAVGAAGFALRRGVRI